MQSIFVTALLTPLPDSQKRCLHVMEKETAMLLLHSAEYALSISRLGEVKAQNSANITQRIVDNKGRVNLSFVDCLLSINL